MSNPYADKDTARGGGAAAGDAARGTRRILALADEAGVTPHNNLSAHFGASDAAAGDDERILQLFEDVSDATEQLRGLHAALEARQLLLRTADLTAGKALAARSAQLGELLEHLTTFLENKGAVAARVMQPFSAAHIAVEVDRQAAVVALLDRMAEFVAQFPDTMALIQQGPVVEVGDARLQSSLKIIAAQLAKCRRYFEALQEMRSVMGRIASGGELLVT